MLTPPVTLFQCLQSQAAHIVPDREAPSQAAGQLSYRGRLSGKGISLQLALACLTIDSSDKNTGDLLVLSFGNP